MPNTDLSHAGGAQASPTQEESRVGGFTLIDKIYDGSICTIYKARQDRLGRLVALKTLREWPPPSDVALERFNRAAYVGAQVVHPNLPVLYESGTADGQHYAALEYIRGRTLQELLAERGRLSERRTVWVALQTARALTALHRRQILHRNVKPKNILMDPEGHVRLIGLGLAHCEAACFSKHLDAQTIGTPHYMAPEMIRGCAPDARSDLYSLGVTMYVMVSGRPPFDKGFPAAVMAKHLYEKPRPLGKLRPDLSDEFVALVESLMMKCPHERPASAKEAVERLERLAAKQHYGSSAPPRRRPWLELDAVRVRRYLMLFLAALSLVFLLGMAAFGLFALLQRAFPARPGIPALVPAASPAPAQEPSAALTLRAAPVAAEKPRPQEQTPWEARRERAYRRLIELDGVFRRDGERGVRQWEAFLRAFPGAPEYQKRQARFHIQMYRPFDFQNNALYQRENPAVRPPGLQHNARAPAVNPNGEDLEF